MRTDEQGAVSGKHVRLSLNAVIGMKARGDLSSNTLLQNDGDSAAEGEVFIGTSSPASSQTITGNDNLVVLSKITSITNADPNTNGTAIPTGVQRAIGQFKFSAAAANNTKNGQNKWTLTDVIFTLIAPNVHFLGDEEYGPSSLKLYNKADPTIKSPCYIFDHTPGSPVYAVGCWDVRAASVNTEIDSGSDATFVLEAEILNAKVSNTQSSSLQVSLDRFADPTLRGMALNLSHMRWLDKDFSASQGYWWVEYPDTVINGTRYQN
jgi:hypothetical protein